MGLEKHNHLSDIEMQFHVYYDISSGQALLKIKYHTRAAEDYGVQYQLGHTQRGEDNPILSSSMSIKEARNVDLRARILHDQALVVKMVDSAGKHLAATKIDSAYWPSGNPGERVSTSYTLSVPKERINAPKLPPIACLKQSELTPPLAP